MAKLAALAAALLLFSPSALAWGGLGHEAICELALRELDDTARERVIALIRQDQEFTVFRASCNWPDRPRQRASEHFVNLPRDAAGLDLFLNESGDLQPDHHQLHRATSHPSRALSPTRSRSTGGCC